MGSYPALFAVRDAKDDATKLEALRPALIASEKLRQFAFAFIDTHR